MLSYYFTLAFRGLRRTPWLALLMILTLAAGLASGMITITLRHALSIDPIPDKSSRLFSLRGSDTSSDAGSSFSYAEAAMLQQIGGVAIRSVASGVGITSMSAADGSNYVNGVGARYTTRGFFDTFDAPIMRGRVWTRAEEQSAAPVVMLSQEMANYFFPTGHAIGGRVYVGDTLFTVVGVVSAWNPQPRYYDLGSPAGAFGGGGDGAFVPLTTMQYAADNLMISRTCPGRLSTLPKPSALLSSNCRWLSVWYLAPTQLDARMLMRVMPEQLQRLFPDARGSKLELLNVLQLLNRAGIVPGSLRLYFSLGTAFLVLCVVNASGMQLSRVLRGVSQLGIRRALGASRMDIIKQYLCDGFVIGSAGGVLGAVLTLGGMYVIRLVPERSMSYSSMASMDGAMFALMIALVLTCSTLIGLVPAWMASRTDPALVIKAPQ